MLRIVIVFATLVAAAESCGSIVEDSGRGGLATIVGLSVFGAGLLLVAVLSTLPWRRTARRLGLKRGPEGLSGYRDGARMTLRKQKSWVGVSRVHYQVYRGDLSWLQVRIEPTSAGSGLARLLGRRDAEVGLPEIDDALHLGGDPLLLRLLLDEAGHRAADLVRRHQLRWSEGMASATSSALDLRTSKVVGIAEAALELSELLLQRARALPERLLDEALQAPTWRAARHALDLLADARRGLEAVRLDALEALQVGEERHRVIAAWAFCEGSRHSPWSAPHEVRPQLRSLATEATDDEVRALALSLLHDDPQATPLLNETTGSDRPMVAATAAWSLLELGFASPEDVERGRRRPNRRVQMGDDLGAYLGGDQRVEAGLIGLLRHPDDALVFDALTALAKVGGVSALRALSQLEGVAPWLQERLEATRKALRTELGDGYGGGLALASHDAEVGGLTLAGAEDGALTKLDDDPGATNGASERTPPEG